MATQGFIPDKGQPTSGFVPDEETQDEGILDVVNKILTGEGEGFVQQALRPENVGATAGDILGGDIGPVAGILGGLGSVAGSGVERQQRKLQEAETPLGKAKATLPSLAGPLGPGVAAIADPETRGETLGRAGVSAGLGAVTPTALGVAGKVVGGGGQLAKTGLKTASDVAERLPIAGATKRIGETLVSKVAGVPGSLSERFAGTLIENMPRGTRILAEHREKQLEKELAEEVTQGNIGGSTMREVQDSLLRRKNQVGQKLDEVISGVDEKISLKGLKEKLTKDLQIVKRTGDIGKKFLSDFEDTITSFNKANFGELSAKDAWEVAKSQKELANLFTKSGAKSASAETVGSKAALDAIQQELINQVKRVAKGSGELFDKYGSLKLFERGMEGQQIKTIPKRLLSMGPSRPGLIDEALLGAVRDPEFITKQLQAQAGEPIGAGAVRGLGGKIGPSLRALLDFVKQSGVKQLIE